MALNNAHEGYEYQDLFTCYFILKEINNENEATFSVDRKEFKEDIIDDLTISSSSGIFKKQIKYSNETVGHVLAKDDLSNDSNYNLAVYRLFDAWDKNRAKNSTEFRICLAWEPPVDSLLNVLIEVNGHGTFSNYPTKVYKIDADKLWPIDQRPLPSWRKFKEASAKIDRNDFLVFCNQFLIEVALPKFSLNLYNAGDLEKLVLELASRLGIGTYPNQHLSKETFLLALLSIVKRARSKALTVSTKSIFHELKIVTDFGSIAQEFPVIQEENLKRTSTVSKFWEDINKEDKILLVGEPGSGKSWFVENLRRNLVSKKITVVRHLCYIGLDDSLQRERIQLDVFFGNLISELIGAFPHLSSFKQQKFASNLSELNLLLSCIDVPTVIIVDGLDHIERIAKFRNFTDIRSQDISIIEHLGKLVLSEKVKIIVASQNIEDLKLIANFQRSELPKWRETEIKSFLTKNKVQNVKLEDGSTLSKFLLSKSGGNPLYLKYLLEEIHKLRNFNLAGLENLPDYTFNLSGYYAYLLSQLNTREEVPQILSGVNFSLTKNELQEITHAGDLVEESLQILSPVLVVNISQSGYRIYHESFRRYILEYLESKSISIDKKIFNPIRDWFATKDFFKFRKSFRYFLKFLNEGGLHEEILSLLKYDFVSNSILNGYSWELIEMNYRIFVKSACSRNDFPNVVLLNEIDKVISLCPIHFEELAPVYLDAIGKVNGFEAVVESLLFEGQPAKGLLEGLKACYVCDENGVVAPWESYLDYFQVGKTINLEDFKYYLRGQLVLNNAKRLNNIAKQLVRKKDTGFCEEFRAELFRYGNQDRIAELRAQFRSIDSLLSLQDGVSGSTLTLDLVYGMADELLAVDNVFTRETDLVVRFLNGCRFFAQDPSLEPTIVNKFKARNWFYNWLIYAVKMICLENKKIDYVKVHEAFAYLAYNVKPFEGKPRTCDLYSLHPVIYNSLNNGLKYLNVTSQWEDIIEILVKVSNGTSTTLQRSANGPLTTEKLFRLLAENSCTENRGLINQTFEMLAEQKSEWHLHTDVSEYHLRLASATSHADPVKASAYLLKGISYGLAYTMRKDLTLLDAIDGVAFFHKINPSKAFEDLKKVRILVDSTISHTDGRETDYFPVTWFERFLTMNRKRAMEYLLNELVASRFDFRAEKSLIDLLCSLNGSLSPVTEAFISLTFPICDTEKFVRYQLVLHGKLKTGNPRLAEMLKSRIISEMRPKKDRNRSNETIRLFNDSVEPNERLTITEKKASNPPKPKPFYQTAEDRQMFSDMDMEGLLAFIQLNGIKESYLHPLVYALDFFDGSDKRLRELVSTIVLKNNQNYYDRLDLDLTFQNGGELECQYWICRFMYDRGDWFERFIFQDAFKRAYAIDPQLALSSFFEILPANLDVGFNSHFSSNLIQLLIDIGYDKATISKMWDNLLQMTSYRLPFQEDIEWDSIYAELEIMDEVELLDCILLSRFKAATTERFRWTSVAIQHLAETNHRGLIKPFQWFLDNKQRFEKSQQVIVLQTIHRVQENKARFAANFRSILTKEFPTGYFLIDYIIQELYQLPINPISHPKGLIYPKIPQEEYDFIHHMNYKFKIYDSVGIDLGDCFNKFSSTLETKYGEYFELYGNRVYRRTISHTYAAEHMLEIMNTDCYEEFLNWSDFDYDGAFKYATFIDINAIRAELFSFGCRPEDLPKPHELNGNLPITELTMQGENWIRIAHFEKELREEGVFKLKPFKGYGGISFSKSPKNKYPYAPYAVYPFQFWWDRKLNLPIDDEIALLVSKDDPIDHINLVWLNPTLIEAMSLKTEISLKGLIAQNQKSEIVLKMRTWSTDYIGTSMRTVLSDEIPLIRGVDLVIREDYFKKLCGMFSNPPRYMSFHIENYFP